MGGGFSHGSPAVRPQAIYQEIGTHSPSSPFRMALHLNEKIW